MPALPLRDYQARTLDALARYFDDARALGPGVAFHKATERPYRTVDVLPGPPYVCLRVPTGGGKTLMAAHAVGLAARHWVERDRVVCLWLVPSTAIRDQTLARLRDPGDPYRQALAARLAGPVAVLDLAEALAVQRGTLDGESVVLVATLAALRVGDTEGRKIYEANGALEHHFTGLAPELLGGLERRADGSPVESLANVLRLRHPVVVMDEAHNARTPLSFDTLARFAPSGVVEFTATPEIRHAPEAHRYASNVLAHVSAAELKAEEMVKLPVRLWTHARWPEAVTEALARRRALEDDAAREQQATGERVRPVVLFQAQPRRAADPGAITVDELRRVLIEDHRVPAEQIARQTSDVHELDAVDINDPACPVRYVITVQALREGWDCPAAYVLCSVAEQASARAVEQLLGRVLRMPGARRKRTPALNEAYAYVVSESFAAAAAGLRDAMVEAGFQRLEAEDLVRPSAGGGAPGGQQPSLFYATAAAPAARVLREPPAAEPFAALAPAVRDAVRFDPGSMTVTATAPLSEVAADALAACFATPEARADVRALARASRGGEAGAAPVPTITPLSARPPLVVPLLAVRTAQGALELFEETHFLDAPWRLAACDAALTEAEYPTHVRGTAAGAVDVSDAGKLEISYREGVTNQLTQLEGEPGWTTAALAVWLDRRIPHPDLTQADVRLFIHHALTALGARAGVTVDQLARDKHRLRGALEAKVARHRAGQRASAYQAALFGPEHLVVEVGPASPAVTFADPDRYAPNDLYAGAYRFRKHVFPRVGDLKADGEEHACAVWLDEHPLVDRWVRNLSNRPAHAFWLQTSTDRFYPDFVGALADGRTFAVEYKGADRWSDDDSREKRLVGELWAAASGGACVFVMPRGPDFGAIEAAFREGATPPEGVR